MKSLLNSLCWLLLLTLNHGYAQEDDAPPPSAEEIKQEAPPAATTQAVLPTERADKNKVFKPSEEISADIAVPFPVDI